MYKNIFPGYRPKWTKKNEASAATGEEKENICCCKHECAQEFQSATILYKAVIHHFAFLFSLFLLVIETSHMNIFTGRWESNEKEALNEQPRQNTVSCPWKTEGTEKDHSRYFKYSHQMYQHAMMTGLSGWPLLLLPLLPGCCVPTAWESCALVLRGNEEFLYKTSSQRRKFYLNFVFLKASCIGLHIFFVVASGNNNLKFRQKMCSQESTIQAILVFIPQPHSSGTWNWLQRLEMLASRW